MEADRLRERWEGYWRLARRYHRYTVEGMEHLRAHEGPALLVCYHGRPIAYDLFMLALSVEEATGRKAIGVVHATAFELPVISDLVTALGWVAGDDEPLSAALSDGALVAVQPGGTREGCRSLRHRHQVDWGRRTGYLRLALRHGLPVIPVACRGIDDGYIGLNNGYRLGKRVGMPGRLPLWFGVGPLGFWPWSPPFPVRLTQRIGRPVGLAELGLPADPDDDALARAHERVKGLVQQLLDRPSPPDTHMTKQTDSPGAKASPAKASPAKASSAKASPAKASSAKASAAKASAAKSTSAKGSPGKAAPAKGEPPTVAQTIAVEDQVETSVQQGLDEAMVELQLPVGTELEKLRRLQAQYVKARRDVEATGLELVPTSPTATWPAVIGMRVRLLEDVDMRGFTMRLARTVVEDFGDAVVVLRAVPGTTGEVTRKVEKGVVVFEVPTPWPAASATTSLTQALRKLLPRPAYVFLDVSAFGAVALVIERHLGERHLSPYHRRMLEVVPNVTHAPDPLPGWDPIYVHQLGKPPPRPTPGLRSLGSWARDWLFGDDKPQGGECYPTEADPMVMCRVHFSKLDGDLGDGSSDPKSWSRLARAATARLVGVAFGGSGAWGYAVLPMLEAMDELNIPVDYVAGVSSGSVMGAYFGTLGKEGCKLVLKRRGVLTATVSASFLSPWFIQAGVGYDLGATSLKDLEVIFLPVASNVSTNEHQWIKDGPVAWGVRAASSAPGGFGPTVVPGGQFVDGAITDNVPVTLLQRMGASFIVGINAIPGPKDSPPPPQGSVLRGLLRTLNPIQRVTNFQRSFALMVHDVGEYEMLGATVYYDAPQQNLPLMRTLCFYDAKKIVEEVKTDGEFAYAVADLRQKWGLLVSPRRAMA